MTNHQDLCILHQTVRSNCENSLCFFYKGFMHALWLKKTIKPPETKLKITKTNLKQKLIQHPFQKQNPKKTNDRKHKNQNSHTQ